VLEHEIGHVLGLLHCCEPAGAGGAPLCAAAPECATDLMYPVYSPATQQMAAGDAAAGACWLYPADACDSIVCEPGETCTMGTCGLASSSCESSADCVAGQLCASGTCSLNSAAIGDPCSADRECFYGLCADGHCSARCSVDIACPAGFDCVSEACATSLGEVGDPCGTSTECVGNECLSGATSSPICTRRCDASTPCSLGWACATVRERPVCRPIGASTCSASPARAQSIPACWIVMLLAFTRRRFR
jgi:hypothetical protein